jgi:hypothetical protein
MCRLCPKVFVFIGYPVFKMNTVYIRMISNHAKGELTFVLFFLQ